MVNAFTYIYIYKYISGKIVQKSKWNRAQRSLKIAYWTHLKCLLFLELENWMASHISEITESNQASKKAIKEIKDTHYSSNERINTENLWDEDILFVVETDVILVSFFLIFLFLFLIFTSFTWINVYNFLFNFNASNQNETKPQNNTHVYALLKMCKVHHFHRIGFLLQNIKIRRERDIIEWRHTICGFKSWPLLKMTRVRTFEQPSNAKRKKKHNNFLIIS